MNIVIKAINKIVFKLQTNTDKWFSKRRAARLNKTDFSIISNNCWGGFVYQHFGLPYLSPTAGIYFFASDYIRFLKDLKYYIDHNVKSITADESKYRDILYKLHQENVPIGLIDDVEVVFLHYKTFEEALDKWDRRKARICWDNLYIKMSYMNCCNDDLVYEFDKLPYKNKFIFVTKDYGIKSQIIMTDRKDDDTILNDTDWFNKYINVTSFINTGDICQ